MLTRRQAAQKRRFLDLPGELLARVAAALDSPAERAWLSACCRTLRDCSRRLSGLWWGSSVEIELASDPYEAAEQAASLSWWLAAQRPAVQSLIISRPVLNLLPPAVDLPLPPLTNLRELKLYSQAIHPEQLKAIGRHTALTSLLLCQCNLLSIKPLGRLAELRVLSLRNNCGLSTAAQLRPLGSCRQLESLDLSFCEVEHFPASWAGLTALSKLSLAHAAFEELPSATSLLSALRHLQCVFSCVGAAGGGLEPLTLLPAIETVDFTGCAIAEIPPSISRLSSTLRSLNLYYNARVAGLQHLSSLSSSLTMLSLAYGELEELPPVISSLTSLQALNLTGNSLGTGWQRLAPLRHLTLLDLSENDFGHCPFVLSTLSSLEVLDCSHNLIDVCTDRWVWQPLLGLSRLRELHALDCGPSTHANFEALSSLFALSLTTLRLRE